MTKVLHVLAGVSAENGGPTAALLGMLRMLKGSTVRCSVAVGVTDSRDGGVLREIASDAVALHTFPRERWCAYSYSGAFARAIGPLVRAHDVLHVHSMWNWPVYRAAVAARAAGVPVIFRPAGAMDKFDVQKHAALKRLLGPLFLRRLFQPPNLFHCTARREAEQLVTYGGAARRAVLPLPVPPAAAVPASVRAATRQRLSLAPAAPVALFLGRLNYKKGLEVLLPALAEVRKTEPDLQLIIAGDGEDDIKRLIGELIPRHGLGGAVHRLGFVAGADKAALIAACDVFVLPSQNENFGMSVVEALAAGLPVVATPGVYILGELAANVAISVCERSVDGVAGALADMLGRVRSDAPGLGRAAVAAWAGHYSPALLRPRYEELYAGIVLPT